MAKEKKVFQAETKQILDLMIHSIYTHKEIFLRELISNASDAIDKLKFEALTNAEMLKGKDELEIFITLDKDMRLIKISDNGIGMTQEEVVQNLGTIAKSGTKLFAQKLKDNKEAGEEVDLIGQFGVGFYSAFMIAKNVTVITKAYGSDAVRWESNGDGTYTIDSTEKDTVGTDIILELRADNEEADYSEFLDEYKIQSLVKKYSDYVGHPVKMNFTSEVTPKDEKGEEIKDAPKETVVETKTLNSMVPLWKKSKSDVTDEEYNDFYKSKFHDWTDPLEVVHTKAEGTVEYTSLLFIPSKAPFDFYSKEFTKGLQLYCKNVFIMEKCEDLIPEHFRFVKGLVDSPDFSLNISREILQHSRQLKIIGKNIEKKIISTLKSMLKDDKAKYANFWKEFGEAIKSGLYTDFANKEKLEDLLVFYSSNSDEITTLAEYVERMKDDQKDIYYVVGQDKASIEKLPQMEAVKEKGYEVLYFFDKIDEFAIERMMNYKEKPFKSITRGDLDLGEKEEDKKKMEETAEENKTLLEKMKESLKDKVSDVKLSTRLKSSAVCLVSDDSGISFGMEKIMKEMPGNAMMPGMKAQRILEINPEHELFTTIQGIYEADNSSELLDDYSELLYDQALLIEGFELEDPVQFANKMAKLMIRAGQLKK